MSGTHARSASPAPESLIAEVEQWETRLNAVLDKYNAIMRASQHEAQKEMVETQEHSCTDSIEHMSEIVEALESLGRENVLELSSTRSVQAEQQYISETIAEIEREDAHPVYFEDLINHLEYFHALVQRFEHLNLPAPVRPPTLRQLVEAAGIRIEDGEERSLFHPTSRRAALYTPITLSI